MYNEHNYWLPTTTNGVVVQESKFDLHGNLNEQLEHVHCMSISHLQDDTDNIKSYQET